MPSFSSSESRSPNRGSQGTLVRITETYTIINGSSVLTNLSRETIATAEDKARWAAEWSEIVKEVGLFLGSAIAFVCFVAIMRHLWMEWKAREARKEEEMRLRWVARRTDHLGNGGVGNGDWSLKRSGDGLREVLEVENVGEGMHPGLDLEKGGGKQRVESWGSERSGRGLLRR